MKRCILFLLLSTLAVAQQQQQRIAVNEERTGPEAQRKYEPTAAERQLGKELLEEAVTQARGLEDPAARAYLLVEAATAYEQVDKQAASELLVEAFQATAVDDDDDRSAEYARRDLQSTIFRRLITAGFNVDELMIQAEPRVRSYAASLLISRAVEKKDFDRAYALLEQIDPDSRFPYGAVEEMMRALPEDRAGERLTLFSQAITHFRNEKAESGVRIGGDGLSEMLTWHWKRLPARSVLEAADLILARAKKDEERSSGTQLTVSTGKGSAQFNSLYEYELFRMLPVLRQLDPAKAERLLAEQRSLGPVLEKYPEGMASLNPYFGDPNASGEEAGMSMSVRSGRGGAAGPDTAALAAAQMNQRAMQIAHDAEKNPRQALASAMTLPEEGRMGSPRVTALQGIVNRTWKSEPSVAREALRELEASVPRLRPFQKLTVQREVVRSYLKMGDHEAAKKAISAGVKLAKEEYERESDQSDPNLAIKPKWQSSNAWGMLLTSAAEISPQSALEILKEVPDKEIQVAQRIALARMWVGAGAPQMSVEVRRKTGTQFSFSE